MRVLAMRHASAVLVRLLVLSIAVAAAGCNRKLPVPVPQSNPKPPRARKVKPEKRVLKTPKWRKDANTPYARRTLIETATGDTKALKFAFEINDQQLAQRFVGSLIYLGGSCVEKKELVWKLKDDKFGIIYTVHAVDEEDEVKKIGKFGGAAFYGILKSIDLEKKVAVIEDAEVFPLINWGEWEDS